VQEEAHVAPMVRKPLFPNCSSRMAAFAISLVPRKASTSAGLVSSKIQSRVI
jgi:hypothetical protein